MYLSDVISLLNTPSPFSQLSISIKSEYSNEQLILMYIVYGNIHGNFGNKFPKGKGITQFPLKRKGEDFAWLQ